MPRRLRENTKKFKKRAGKYGSFGFIPEFLEFSPVKEWGEINVAIGDMGTGGVRIGGSLMIGAQSKMCALARLRISRVSNIFAVAEKIG